LLQYLARRDYRFTAVTPLTHERVVARRPHGRPDLRDVFGWNRAFSEDDVESRLLDLLERGELLERRGSGQLRSRVRIASLSEHLFLHSAFPTDDEDSVFFGPDTYRFWRYLEQQLKGTSARRHLVDMGAGSGAGGILTARLTRAQATTLVDINEQALQFARANAAAAEVRVELVRSDELPTDADLVIANPPYLMDEGKRTYRDGGELLGGALSFEWAKQALGRMSPGGILLMYTGAAFAQGRSPLLRSLEALCAEAAAPLSIEEIDPDVFGEELDRPQYAKVERIAAVGIRIEKPQP